MPNKFLSDIELDADLIDVNGDTGTVGQILSSLGTGSGVDWIDQGDIIAGEADKAKSVIIRVKNSTLSAMTKGQVICEAVSISPPSGNLIEVALADNNGTDTMPALGILNEDLDAAGGNNDEGDAIMFGKVSGIDTFAFSVGDEVFVDDTPGGLTTTKPTGVKYIQKVGVVIRKDASNGTIEVFGAGRVNDVPTPLYIDHANQRLGVGEEDPDTLLHLSGNSPTIKLEDNVAIDFYNPKIEFFGSLEGGTLEYISNPSFAGMQLHYINSSLNKNTFLRLTSGKAAFVSDVTGGTTLETDGVLKVTGSNDSYISNGSFGIGTTLPNYKLHVEGNSYINATDNSANLTLGRYTGQPTIKAGSDDSGYLIMDSTGGSAALNWYASDNVVLARGGGGVGIGTPSPSEKLHVEGNMRLENQFYDSTNSEGAVNQVLTKVNAGTEWKNVSDLPIESRYVAVAGDIMTGNLTMSNAQIQINDSGTQARLNLNNTGTGDSQINFQLGGSSKFTIGVDNDDSDKFKISGSSALGSNDIIVVDSTGNVGIGTTNPDGKLHIDGISDTISGLVLEASNNGDNRSIDFHNTAGALRLGIEYDNANINLDVVDRSRNKLFTIRESGNVGIGIINPQTTLHMGVQAANPTGTEEFRLESRGSSGFGGNSIINLYTGQYGTSGVYFGDNPTYSSQPARVEFIDVSSALNYDSTQYHNWKVSGSTKMTLNNDFLGIGITNPQSGLHLSSATDNRVVGGTDKSILRLTNTYAGAFGAGGEIQFGVSDSASGRDVLSLIKGSYTGYSGGNYGGDLEFHTRKADGNGLQQRMTIDENGNVGIGTPDPSTKLEINGTGHNATFTSGCLKIEQPDGTSMFIDANDIDVSTGILFLQDYSLNPVRVGGNLQIPNGLVGIGMTTNPSEKLHVYNGSAYIAPIAYAANQNDWVIRAGAYNNTSFDQGLKIKSTSSGVSYMSFETAHGGGETMVLKSGNVGIGTNLPASKLDVNGGIRMADDSSTASASNVGTLRYRTSGNNSYVDMCMQTGASTYAWVNIVQNSW